MMMPPNDESAFPALPMFAADAGELARATAPANMLMIATSVSDALAASAMAFGGVDGVQAQSGLSYSTRYGVLKAELVSQGAVQTSLEGLQPLPFTTLNMQLAFMQRQLAMGGLQAAVMTPLGAAVANANLAGQTSAEIVTGMAPSPTSQLMLGAHFWGVAGQYGGVKAALEWQSAIMDGDELKELGTITLACTRPHQGSSSPSSVSLSAAYRTANQHSLVASVDKSDGAGAVIAMGGSRKLSDAHRLRGRWATNGVLGVALECASEHSMLSVCAQVNSTPGKDLEPKFGATIQISP